MKMNVLVINCGSSSLKYQLINSDSEAVLAKGLCERIGIDGRLVYQKTGCDKEITEAAMPTHKEAIQMVLDALTNDKTGAIGSLKEVNAVGHRVVHGGEKFAKSVVITDEVISAVEECNDLAGIHQSYTSSVRMISSARLRMLFIRRTHSIWSAAFRASVAPSCFVIAETMISIRSLQA